MSLAKLLNKHSKALVVGVPAGACSRVPVIVQGMVMVTVTVMVMMMMVMVGVMAMTVMMA